MIGEKIRMRRIELKITQEELAQKVGYKSKTTINKIELVINDITQTKVYEFAKALETIPSYLMEWTDDR
jgi:transcriptional regulator with XRE-family HTH domain